MSIFAHLDEPCPACGKVKLAMTIGSNGVHVGCECGKFEVGMSQKAEGAQGKILRLIRNFHSPGPDFKPTVNEIVSEYLKKNGFDGLVNVDVECGCDLEDLAPCGNIYLDCQAGYLGPCNCGNCDFHIYPNKPEGTEDDDEA